MIYGLSFSDLNRSQNVSEQTNKQINLDEIFQYHSTFFTVFKKKGQHLHLLVRHRPFRISNMLNPTLYVVLPLEKINCSVWTKLNAIS